MKHTYEHFTVSDITVFLAVDGLTVRMSLKNRNMHDRFAPVVATSEVGAFASVN